MPLSIAACLTAKPLQAERVLATYMDVHRDDLYRLKPSCSTETAAMEAGARICF